jgi:hypothetical protein
VPVGEPGLADLVVDGVHDGLHSVAATAEDLWTGVRLWFSFTGQAAGTSAPDSTVTIHCDETNQDFVFTLSASSIARPTVVAMLVLDQSGSMNDQAGATGVTASRRCASQPSCSWM